jgi:hypothetical protein
VSVVEGHDVRVVLLNSTSDQSRSSSERASERQRERNGDFCRFAFSCGFGSQPMTTTTTTKRRSRHHNDSNKTTAHKETRRKRDGREIGRWIDRSVGRSVSTCLPTAQTGTGNPGRRGRERTVRGTYTEPLSSNDNPCRGAKRSTSCCRSSTPRHVSKVGTPPCCVRTRRVSSQQGRMARSQGKHKQPLGRLVLRRGMITSGRRKDPSCLGATNDRLLGVYSFQWQARTYCTV